MMSTKIALTYTTIITLLFLVQLQSKLIVHGPPELVTYFSKKYGDKGIPFSLANYGQVPYGKTISGKIGIPTVLEDCIYESIPKANEANIILVERQDCTFTQKSINVQKQGGKLAIVIDSHLQNPGWIVMIDDGKGFQVHIPTILITQQDGEMLVSNVDKGIEISVNFEVVQQNVAEISIWLDITNHKDLVFMRNFRQYFNKLQSFTHLSIGYPVTACYSNCSQDNCFIFPKWESSVNFCRSPKPSDFLVKEAGLIILKEQLRQYLIYKQSSQLWWIYLLNFDQRCIELTQYQNCSQQILKTQLYNSLDKKALEKEMNKLLNNTNGSLVKLLSKWLKQKQNNFIVYYPSVIVNRVVYRGNLEPVDIYSMMCQSISPTPQVCLNKTEEGGVSTLVWIVVAVVLMGLYLAFLCCCYRRRIKKEMSSNMHKRVNSLVNQYITMYEEQKYENESWNEKELEDK